MRLKFVDLFCGGGGASFGASATGLFDVHAGVDADPEALSVFAANFPSANLGKLSLPCEMNHLNVFFPTDAPFHVHAAPPTSSTSSSSPGQLAPKTRSSAARAELASAVFRLCDVDQDGY